MGLCLRGKSWAPPDGVMHVRWNTGRVRDCSLTSYGDGSPHGNTGLLPRLAMFRPEDTEGIRALFHAQLLAVCPRAAGVLLAETRTVQMGPWFVQPFYARHGQLGESG